MTRRLNVNVISGTTTSAFEAANDGLAGELVSWKMNFAIYREHYWAN